MYYTIDFIRIITAKKYKQSVTFDPQDASFQRQTHPLKEYAAKIHTLFVVSCK